VKTECVLPGRQQKYRLSKLGALKYICRCGLTNKQSTHKFARRWLFLLSVYKLKCNREDLNMELNLLKWAFSCMAVYVVVMGFLINSVQKHLPVILNSAFRYGKFADMAKSSQLKSIEIPKR
jgi:hypothetical protein